MVAERAGGELQDHPVLNGGRGQTRRFYADCQTYAGIGLQVEEEPVPRQAPLLVNGKKARRRPAEGDHDLGEGSRTAFAGANVERDAGPSPVVDLYFHSNVGFGVRTGVYAGLLAVTGDGLPVDRTGAVLAAH